MERRAAEIRRQDHLFVADERREGPHDRRGDEARRRERMREQEKIEKIRAFKARDKPSPSDTLMINKKRLVFLGLALLVIVVALILLQ
jgi:hypothetical protein